MSDKSIKVYGYFDRPPVRKSCSGTDKVIERTRFDDGTGNLTFPVVGEHSQREYINSFRGSCDLDQIVMQAKLANNPGLLIRDNGTGMEGDFSSLPDNKIDMMKAGAGALEYYRKLADKLPFASFEDFISGKVDPARIGKNSVPGSTDPAPAVVQNTQNKEVNK